MHSKHGFPAFCRKLNGFLLFSATPFFARHGFESRWDHHIGRRAVPKERLAELRVFFPTFPFPSYSVNKTCIEAWPSLLKGSSYYFFKILAENRTPRQSACCYAKADVNVR